MTRRDTATAVTCTASSREACLEKHPTHCILQSYSYCYVRGYLLLSPFSARLTLLQPNRISTLSKLLSSEQIQACFVDIISSVPHPSSSCALPLSLFRIFLFFTISAFRRYIHNELQVQPRYASAKIDRALGRIGHHAVVLVKFQKVNLR